MDLNIEIFNSEKIDKEMVPLTPDTTTNASTRRHIDELLSLGRNLPVINDTYEIVWTPEVVSRVSAIVFLIILTLIGNLTLLILILCHRKLRKRRVNIFLVNLAIGDIMVCLVTMTTEIVFVAFGEWVLGEAGCKLTVYGQIVTLASTTFLLTAMSIDRYQVIVRPLQSLRGKPKIWHKVAAAWAMAFLFATPQLFIFVQTDEGVRPDGHIKHQCLSRGYQPGQTWQRKAYFTFLTSYILVIPTCIMSFCYINIIRVVFMRAGDNSATPKLRFTSSRRPSQTLTRKCSSDSELEYALNGGSGAECRGRRRSSRHASRFSLPKKLISSSKRNVVKMTLSVIIAFILCWSPYFIFGLIRIYSEYKIRLDQLYSFSEIMAMLHSALNPILYGAFSTNSAIKTVRASCLTRRKSENIVVNISVGSDFDSLVFVTHPEVYTRRFSLADSKTSESCGCIWLAEKLCALGSRDKRKLSKKYSSVSQARGSPHKHVSSSIRSQQSVDSRVYTSSSTRMTHASSLSCNSNAVDCSQECIHAPSHRRASLPSERHINRVSSLRNDWTQGQGRLCQITGSIENMSARISEADGTAEKCS